MCVNPRVLIHPALPRFFQSRQLTEIHLDESVIIPEHPFRLPYRSLLQKYRNIYATYPDSKELNKHFYAYNPETGFVHPLFFYAPCNHCVDCSASRYASIASRLQLECASYPLYIRPIFFTLTYDNEHLPSDGSVSRLDFTDFLNKLALNCKRVGLSTPRVFGVSEYGSDPRYTRRPHYHGIIFGMDLTSKGSCTLFNKAFHKSWQRCRYERAVWELARKPQALSRYVCKYVIKGLTDNSVPEGKKPNFVSMPRKSGGLGFPALRDPELLDKILKSEDGTITVKTLSFDSDLNKSIFGTCRIRIPRAVIQKIFPSWSRFMTKNIRRALSWLVCAYNQLISRDVFIETSPSLLFPKFRLVPEYHNDVSFFLVEYSPLNNPAVRPHPSWYMIDSEKLLAIYTSCFEYLKSYKFDSDYSDFMDNQRRKYLAQIQLKADYRYNPDRTSTNSRFISKLFADSPLDYLS